MTSIHISEKAIWLDSSPELLALNDKTILIIYPEEEEQNAHLRIFPADPSGFNKGKCSIKVWDSFLTEAPKFENYSPGKPPEATDTG